MNIEQLRNGEPALATMIRGVNNPIVAKLASNAGFDAVMLDLEHGSFAMSDVEQISALARALGLLVTVRVPELARGYVSRVLDCGAHGVMVPMLETPEQARKLVEWAKFAPVGGRGLSSFGGHTDFESETDVKAFMAAANRETLAIAQIETAAGAENADLIAELDGIDMLLIGPNDLACSLGCPGELEHARVEQAIGRVAAACNRHGKIFGMHAGEPLLAKWRGEGLSFIMQSIDMIILANAFRSLRESMQSLI